MTTRANREPVHVASCRCGYPLYVYQARGRRAYLYSRCLVCGFNQRPHSVPEQARLWSMLPADVQAAITRPLILAAPSADVCPCCGRAAA